MKKENSRESASIFEKKSLGLLKRKKTHLHRNVKRINWWEGQKIKKQLFFAEKNEIREAEKGKKNSKQSICSVISGKILRKYKPIRYAARTTNTDRRKLSNRPQHKPNKSKRGFEPNLYKAVINFYNHDDVSTALSGKRDAKKVKQWKPRIQKRVLNNYLSNLHQKFVSEHTNMSCSFTSFARMRLKNFVLANFTNRRTCLCTKRQNYALKLKMLRKHTGIPRNPEVFVKYSYQKISSIMVNIKQQSWSSVQDWNIQKNENDHPNHQSSLIQNPFAEGYTDISEPY